MSQENTTAITTQVSMTLRDNYLPPHTVYPDRKIFHYERFLERVREALSNGAPLKLYFRRHNMEAEFMVVRGKLRVDDAGFEVQLRSSPLLARKVITLRVSRKHFTAKIIIPN